MAFRLLAIAGPVKGERFTIGSGLAIGRSSRGLTLPDVDVSVRHAELSVVNGRVRVKDLDSATGTRIGDRTVSGEGDWLEVGEQLCIGESVFRLEDTKSFLLKTAVQLVGPLLGVCLATVGILVWRAGPESHRLRFAEPVRTPGPVTELEVPLGWLRTHGLGVADIEVSAVRDDNADGVDEFWLRAGRDEYLVTHGPDGVWRELGRFPRGCRALPHTSDWPEIACGSVIYGMAADGYVPLSSDTVVVWVRGDKDLHPVRVDVEDPRAFSGLLAANGVLFPTHLLVCEDVFPGVPAQAVTEGGRVVPLTQGCGTALSMKGSRLGDRVVAVSSTESARAGFPAALSAALGGGRGGALLGLEATALLEPLAAWPEPGKGDLLVSGGALQGLQTAAREEPGLEFELRTDTPQKPTYERVFVESGTTRIDVGECSYVVEVGSFRCAIARGCTPATSFVTVLEEGCGEPTLIADVGYGGGTFLTASERTRVGVRVMADNGVLTSDVRRVTVGLSPL